MSEQESNSEMIPLADCLRQVLITVERLAMLHYHYAQTLIAELGDQRGKELIAKAIASYGREVGERHRQRVIEAGFEPSCENYNVVPDLPTLAWSPRGMPVLRSGDKERPVCPMAKYWIERGAEDLGRLYCYVDQAKFAAFDPECECRHTSNVLDGDDCCQLVAKKKADWDEPHGGKP